MEVRAQTVEAHAQTVESRARAAEAYAQSMETRAQTEEARAQAAEAHAQAAEVRMRQADARLRELEARAHAAKMRAQQAEARARKAKARLARMRSSISWRATKPIRITAKSVSRRLVKPVDLWIGRRLFPLKLFLRYQKAILYRRPSRFRGDVASRKLTWSSLSRDFCCVDYRPRRPHCAKMEAPPSGLGALVKLAMLLGKPVLYPTPRD